jgi:hypothetical protein
VPLLSRVVIAFGGFHKCWGLGVGGNGRSS